MASARSLQVGSAAPRFKLAKLAGGSKRLEEYLERGAVLLAFFKISCPVCQLTLPYLNRMRSGNLQLVAVSQDDEESTGEFNAEFGISLETLLDPEDGGYPVSNAYALTQVPTIFVVEQDGTIGEVIHGFVKREMEAIGVRCGIAPFQPGDYAPEWKAG
jgi:peroxiredoxin